MKKMRRGVALLATVLLLGIPVSTASASEVSGTTDVHEEIQMQAAEGESVQVPEQLTFGKVTVVQDSKVITPSGEGWEYDSSTNTLYITKDVTIEANIPKIIESTGDLHITVESGATLTVESTMGENRRYAIYADGNITLGGEGIIDIKHEDQRDGIRAQKGITIRGITLNLLSGGNCPEIRANGGELVIEDAVVTANGLCMAWNDSKNYYPVHILGQSVVNIESTNASGGLRGAEFEFSDCAHVKIKSGGRVIGSAFGSDSKLVFNFVNGQKDNFYFRAKAGDSFTKGTVETSSNYFEYIGANHVNKDKNTITPNGGTTHTMECQCEGKGKTSIIASCSGGMATCTTQAECEVCGQSYGDKDPHQYNEYHVCSVCGEPYTSDDPDETEKTVVVVVVADGEKRGYTSGEMGDAIDFAGTHPGAVLTIIDPARECLDKLKVNNPDADFTIELDGKNNGNYGSVTVSSGKVTIKDSKTGGTFFHITTQGTGNVTLESGTIKSGAEVTNGTFNVAGGTISRIDLTDGQLNWNSSTAEGTEINYKGQSKMTINAVPKSTLFLSLPIKQDLSQPVAVLGAGISLPENMLAIEIGNIYRKYTLKPVVQDNQIYACLPLTQLGTDDIVLEADSGFTYNGKEQKPSVTVQRYMPADESDYTSKGYLTEGTDYTVTYKDNVNAGTATVTITGIGYYMDSVERTFTISKAAPEQATVDADSRTYSCRVDNADRVNLAAYLPKDHGAITAATATADGALTYSSTPSVAGGVLSYTIQSSAATKGAITVTVSTTNYEDITIRIPVETKDIGSVKLATGAAVTLQDATLTEGEKLSTLKFNEAVFVDEAGNEVPGTLAFRTPDEIPAVGTVDVEWVFQPTDTENYAAVWGTVTVTVKEKTTSGGDSGSGDDSSGGTSGGTSGGSSSGGSSSGGSSSGGGSFGGGGGAAGTTDPKDDTKQDDTGKDDSKQDDQKDDDTKQDETAPAPVGTKVKDSSGTAYQVTSDGGKKPTVAYKAAAKKAKGTVTIPKTVTIDGTKYKVTSIAAKAFAGNKNVKRIVLSQNITEIGANAFADCPKLKTITIHSTKLTSKNVADGAFAGIEEGTVIRVPQKMLARYQKLFAKKGLSEKVKVVAIKDGKK